MAKVSPESRVRELLDAVRRASRGDTAARAAISAESPGLDALARAINQLIAFLGVRIADGERALEACAAAQERYRLLEAIIPGMVYTFQLDSDGNHRFLYASEAARELFHVEPEDLVRDGSLIAGRIHPDDRERRDESIRQSLETLRPWREELRHIIDGEVRWHDCMSRPELGPDGNVLWCGIIQDVTQRKRAEEALREGEEKFRRLHESMMDAFAATDMEGRITESNRAYEEMLGYSGEELRQLTYQELTLEKWHSTETTIIEEQVLPRGFSDVYEKEYFRKDGSLFPVEVRTFLIRDSAGQPSRMWAIVRDITERKRAEQERTQLEARLSDAQKMESIGRLAGGVAHDFNNMLAVISGFTELALAQVQPDNPLREYLVEIEKAAIHSTEITAQLLAFSRRQILARRPTDLNDLISSRKSTLARLIGEDIELRFAAGKEALRVNVDAAQIEQILINLAVNARDAMPAGGILTIEASRLTIDEAYCRIHAEFTPGDHVLLAVSDTRAGMDEEDLSHCFEPFFTTKETGRGTGLGLATVYGIVKQSGGLINVYSEPGHGTVFTVYLPAIAAEPGPADTERKGPPAKGDGTILLVEDEEMVRHLAAEMLRTLGYTVVAAGTPAEAASICRMSERTIDLLLTDVVMPGMNGVQLRDQIRGILPGVKVLFMSGFTSDEVLHRGVAEETVSFVQKPFSLNGLARAVRAALADERA